MKTYEYYIEQELIDTFVTDNHTKAIEHVNTLQKEYKNQNIRVITKK